ncbi:NAD(P)-binding protein [Amylocystis lapponica]|nr:NAD(P)-binding protein [Amylocystis lapponica]
MRIAITGCSGYVGQPCVTTALARGHTVVGIDIAGPRAPAEYETNPAFSFISADLCDYDATFRALQGCEGVIQLASVRTPGDYVAHTHNTNVVITWNVLRAAAELGIKRIAQASSVNVLRMVWSAGPKPHYFPFDEDHPTEPDDPYGLSKVICEIQADTIVRRWPDMRIASLRLHWSVPDREAAFFDDEVRRRNDLWGYVLEDAAADAFLLAVTGENGKWSGHERFFIAAPDKASPEDTEVLIEKYWSHVPIKEGKTLKGSTGFVDCSKAQQLLGWVHPI